MFSSFWQCFCRGSDWVHFIQYLLRHVRPSRQQSGEIREEMRHESTSVKSHHIWLVCITENFFSHVLSSKAFYFAPLLSLISGFVMKCHYV